MEKLDYKKDYTCDIRIWKTEDMENSKSMIKTNNNISVLVATTSYLENLLRIGIIDEEKLKLMCDLAIKSFKGDLDDDENSN